MDLKIRDKVAVVTGGGNGIGEAVAMRLASEGVKIVVVDLSVEAAEKVAGNIKEGGGESLSVACDATKPEDVDGMMDKATKAYGAIDILVNNVGGGTGINLAVKSLIEDWDKTIEMNLRSAYLCCCAAAKMMIPRKQGRIINMSSISGNRENRFWAPTVLQNPASSDLHNPWPRNWRATISPSTPYVRDTSIRRAGKN